LRNVSNLNLLFLGFIFLKFINQENILSLLFVGTFTILISETNKNKKRNVGKIRLESPKISNNLNRKKQWQKAEE